VSAIDENTETKYSDLEYLKIRTKSNRILMMEMISLYLAQTPVLITEMKQGLKNKDWHSMYTAVHKLIPSFSIMGINADFETMARKVQDFANNQQQSKGIPEMVVQLENVCMQACEELKEELNTIKNSKK
jgi:HPt (histidine-containing phosphotransfer) domain-containing protein